MANEVVRAEPLPVARADLLARYKLMRQRTLNDYVDDIHVALWDNKDYRDALEATSDEDAIEGSLSADNFLAAGMIRDYARKHHIERVQGKKLYTIVKALNVVLRRYGISRAERATRIGETAVAVEEEAPAAEAAE